MTLVTSDTFFNLIRNSKLLLYWVFTSWIMMNMCNIHTNQNKNWSIAKLLSENFNEINRRERQNEKEKCKKIIEFVYKMKWNVNRLNSLLKLLKWETSKSHSKVREKKSFFFKKKRKKIQKLRKSFENKIKENKNPATMDIKMRFVTFFVIFMSLVMIQCAPIDIFSQLTDNSDRQLLYRIAEFLSNDYSDESSNSSGVKTRGVSEQVERCRLPMRRGLCRALMPRWHYDPVAKTCLEFKFGG